MDFACPQHRYFGVDLVRGGRLAYKTCLGNKVPNIEMKVGSAASKVVLTCFILGV